ncbi:PRKR-interacting protein 1 homolog [Neocloeon triangulifer]|uniref:PRKR-interacting protein 1 homolog n=1 Tax=Neocloeon triangulifer TaxID=2078957 RepID=UPI00286F0ACE|nr:PRKR-interacting protein 1 homolog [Neocloeon triangulifer]
MDDKKEENEEKKKLVFAKTMYDVQRIRLERLMQNPDKPIIIPERPKERQAPDAPDFVRNVMGSSAGAGSGEFHVYRHLRRKEYARQRAIQEKAKREQLDDNYQKKLDDNKMKADEKTAKKRAKRLKKKGKQKNKKPKTAEQKKDDDSESDTNDDEEKSESEEGSEKAEKGQEDVQREKSD